ncbi:hypothetical protein GE09DRAFT_1162355 [Coniochaeta sp. 2T2.1]|nr:hypothetical protein GE09DRAFT_1162355 [Coniochaeta sp. 2T2.1]
MYQISWPRNPDWNSLFPVRSELVEYYKKFAEHYGLPACTLFNRHVLQATWSEDRALWIVDVQDKKTGIVTRWSSKVLVQAAGVYNRKVTPSIPGIDTFKGDTWHNGDWPDNYDFAGKTVAYVGTGPTLIQVIPTLQAQAASVKVFCRSMTYCHPFINLTYPTWVKWAFRRIPGLMALWAWTFMILFGTWAYFAFRPATWVARNTERYCRRVLHKQVRDPVLREKLAPTGRFGAKRPMVSLAGFFNVLQKDNVEVIKNPIVGVDASGVITTVPRTKGQIEGNLGNGHAITEKSEDETDHTRADVLIWGTGYLMQGWEGAVHTIGRSGVVLREKWLDETKTLYATMTSSFPNMFILGGPNTTSPWASLIRGLEYQAAHNSRIIRHIYEQTWDAPLYSLEPRLDKEAEWTESMQSEVNKLATSPKYGPA